MRNLKEGKSITKDIETKISRRIVEQMQQWWEEKTEASHMKERQNSAEKKHHLSSVGVQRLITPKKYYMNTVKESQS